ncbi:peptidoglycan-binding domain-containing protein [Anaeromicropila herbilytica]|uniref:Peptidoglycan binding-like domain-containing protein n=1 Tax=Anaeromicropila herbilytica TaxID=2785025 RepID=A0A7R7ENJ7_9FIRM|nr:peptidoglycan-binding domain-containing protein [Anaeromicropila herbilytica]BCN32083.1 hypothetical protein bsdtb5_33780 [Anaeromicropila herbilytica]
MDNFKRILAKIMIVLCLSSMVTPYAFPISNSESVVRVQAATYSKSTVYRVQEKLNYHGYSCGEPDGKIGNHTKTAIREYQKDKGLKVTGTINKSLLKSLHIKATSTTVSNKKERIVYVTESGKKYHRDGCRYLWHSRIPMKLSEAKKYYEPCSVCNP